MVIEKKCNNCGDIKTIDNYHKSKNTKSGVRGVCKKCIKDHYEINKDDILDKSKKYREENKEKLKKRRKKEYIKNKETYEQYYEENKEYILIERKKYHKKNKEKLNKKSKEYNEKNKYELLKNKKEYYEENKKEIKEKQKKYRAENKEYFEKYNKEYRENNKEKLNKKSAEWAKDKIDNDPSFYLKEKLRDLFKKNMKNKNKSKQKKFKEYTGFRNDEYENHFKVDPLWIKYCNGAGLHIDHIIPVSSYDFNDLEEIKKCWNPLNLRLLPATENMSKGNKIDMDLIKKHNIEHLLPEDLKYEF